MPQEITKFEKILNKFYRRIEKDEDFFSYYNIDVSEIGIKAENLFYVAEPFSSLL